MMKKLLLIVTILLSTVGLMGCQKASETKSDLIATVIVKSEKETKTYKDLTVKNNETVLDLLKSKATVKENSGFITEINGQSQDTTKNIYWMYTINGKEATKGANQEKVKSGDIIEFDLKAIK